MSKTICELVEIAKKQLDDDMKIGLVNTLDEIQKRAGAMEDRLLLYCNAIEALGFSRNGRDYE